MKTILLILLVVCNIAIGQTLKFSCTEKERKNDGGEPILVKTCFMNNFKFINIKTPDYAGRYYNSEHIVFIRINNKYVKTVNSQIFQKNQSELIEIINNRIQQDFISMSSDSTNSSCLKNLKSIPTYTMDQLEISFENDEIWFEVHWELTGACRSVDGTIVSFKISEIQKYIN